MSLSTLFVVDSLTMITRTRSRGDSHVVTCSIRGRSGGVSVRNWETCGGARRGSVPGMAQVDLAAALERCSGSLDLLTQVRLRACFPAHPVRSRGAGRRARGIVRLQAPRVIRVPSVRVARLLLSLCFREIDRPRRPARAATACALPMLPAAAPRRAQAWLRDFPNAGDGCVRACVCVSLLPAWAGGRW